MQIFCFLCISLIFITFLWKSNKTKKKKRGMAYKHQFFFWGTFSGMVSTLTIQIWLIGSIFGWIIIVIIAFIGGSEQKHRVACASQSKKVKRWELKARYILSIRLPCMGKHQPTPNINVSYTPCFFYLFVTIWISSRDDLMLTISEHLALRTPQTGTFNQVSNDLNGYAFVIMLVGWGEGGVGWGVLPGVCYYPFNENDQRTVLCFILCKWFLSYAFTFLISNAFY